MRFFFNASLALVLIIGFLMGTETGLKTDFDLAKILLPGKLNGQAEGRLLGPLTLTDFSYKGTNFSLKIASLKLDWQPLQLFQKTFLINSLNVEDLRIAQGKKVVYLQKVQLHGQGVLQGYTGFSWQAELSGQGLNPQYFLPQLPGDLNFKLKGLGNTANPQHELQIQLENLSGTLMGESVRGSGKLIKQGAQFILVEPINLTAGLGLANIHIQGQVGQSSDLTWAINLPPLQLTSEGHLQGSQQNPSMTAKVKIKSFKIKNITLDTVNLDVEGHLLSHEIKLNVQQDKNRLNLLLKGRYENQSWSATLEQLNLTSPRLANWSLIKPAIFTIGKETIKINPVCWRSSSNQLCMELDKTSQKIKGKLNLNMPNLILSKLGLDLKKLQVIMTSTGDQLVYTASAVSGTGTVYLKGNTDLSTQGLPSTLHITGENVQISHTDSAKAIATPNLVLTYKDSALNMTGSVLIPTANITPTDFSSTIEMPHDVVYTDTKKESASSLNITSKIALSLGDQVHFAYKGLDTKIKGNILLIDNPDGSTTGNGELIITKGKYVAYGQNLTISDGRLLFAGGPITDPGLSIEAVRYVNFYGTASNTQTGNINDQNKVGLNIVGTLQKPIVTLFSIPGGLTQTQILSYLVLGHSLEQSTTSSEGQSIASAAMALNLAGRTVTEIQNKVKSLFGLSDLEVGQQQQYSGGKNGTAPNLTQNTSLILGKYLTPKLYVNLSVGLAEPINTLNVTYQFVPHWRIQTNASSLGSGIDLVYTLERDGFGLFGPAK